MNDHKLKKELSGFVGFIMVIGTVIGSGIFFKPRAVFSVTGTATLGLIAWLIGGLLALAGGLIIAEIGTLIPETGGMLTYLEKIYSKKLGFMVAWAQSVAFYPAVMGGLASIAAVQIMSLLNLTDSSNAVVIRISISIFLLFLATFINSLGNKKYDLIQNLTMFLKLVPIFVIIVMGLFLFHGRHPIELTPVIIPSHPLLSALSHGVLGTLFAMDGWMNVTSIAGELKNPGKDLPKAIIGGIGFVTVIYLLVNMAYLKILPAEALAVSATPAADVAKKIFPAYGGNIISMGIIVSVFGGLLGYTRAAWRIPYALGLRNWVPYSEWFAKIDERNNLPLNSGKFLFILTSLFCILIGDFDKLTDISQFVIWIFYILSFIGIFILRKRWPDRERPYKTTGYPIVPILGIFGAAFIIVSTMIFQFKLAMLSLVIVGIGLPVYLYSIKKYGVK